MIWVFAEERSGSTWFCETLSVKLGKTFTYLEVLEPKSDHIHQAHDFSWIPQVDGVFLRTTRRDKLEHFLSVALLNSVAHTQWWHRPHVFRQHYGADIEALAKVFSGEPLTIRELDVDAYFQKLRERDRFWDCRHGAGQVVHYEDLSKGVFVEALNVWMKFSDSDITVKLPYSKRDLIANLQQVETWVKERTWTG